jgi:predicted dehydrogenase
METSAQTPVRAGLIGCGDISSSHLKTYAACGIELAALCDVDRARAEKRRTEFGRPDTPVFTDHRELLGMADIDFVTVATPVAFHAPLTIDALRAGKHVACEKPSTLSLGQNRAVIEEARKAHRKVIFFSSRMRWGGPELAAQYISEGALGDIYRVDVQFYRRRGRPGLDIIPDARWFLDSERAGGGVVMDMGQYFMDMVLNLVGWPQVRAVSAVTYRGHPADLPPGVRFDVEEHCTILARAERDLTLTFDLAWIAHNPPRRAISILGTQGGIRMDDGSPFTFYCDKGGPWRWMNTMTEWRDKTQGNEHVYREFIQAVRGNDPGIGTTPEEALAITELTQMALLSGARGCEVTREELPED